MKINLVLVFILILSCTKFKQTESIIQGQNKSSSVELIILGTTQDAGVPHAGCIKDCCKERFELLNSNLQVVSLGLIDRTDNKTFLFEASPDLPRQMHKLSSERTWDHKQIPDGIFLTHAHIGHYSGLMYLGKESVNTSNVPVFCMPRMHHYLSNNGPWDQLVNNENIKINPITRDSLMKITNQIKVRPFMVPHRDEYSETVGYEILGPTKSALFIPDIDKWYKWDKNIIDEIKRVDYALIDGTFYHGEEINHRDVSQIPHPFVEESMKLFDSLPLVEREKIYFIHFNHTNPIIEKNSSQYKLLILKGYSVAEYDLRIFL
jgi:pyrroloquinoline quinone biosynthesis protein B